MEFAKSFNIFTEGRRDFTEINFLWHHEYPNRMKSLRCYGGWCALRFSESTGSPHSAMNGR
jgi:hypothetical protein